MRNHQSGPVGDLLEQTSHVSYAHHSGHVDAVRQGLTLEFSDNSVIRGKKVNDSSMGLRTIRPSLTIWPARFGLGAAHRTRQEAARRAPTRSGRVRARDLLISVSTVGQHRCAIAESDLHLHAPLAGVE